MENNNMDEVLLTLENKLHIHGIETEIIIHKDRTVTISASKQIGITVKHASIHSNSLTDALWKLIQFIEKELEEWLDKHHYGC